MRGRRLDRQADDRDSQGDKEQTNPNAHASF
jgi:hypothetical protein